MMKLELNSDRMRDEISRAFGLLDKKNGAQAEQIAFGLVRRVIGEQSIASLCEGELSKCPENADLQAVVCEACTIIALNQSKIKGGYLNALNLLAKALELDPTNFEASKAYIDLCSKVSARKLDGVQTERPHSETVSEFHDRGYGCTQDFMGYLELNSKLLSGEIRLPETLKNPGMQKTFLAMGKLALFRSNELVQKQSFATAKLHFIESKNIFEVGLESFGFSRNSVSREQQISSWIARESSAQGFAQNESAKIMSSMVQGLALTRMRMLELPEASKAINPSVEKIEIVRLATLAIKLHASNGGAIEFLRQLQA